MLRRVASYRLLLALGLASVSLAAFAVACSSSGGDDLPTIDDEAGASDRYVPPVGDGGTLDAAEAGVVTAKQACEAYLQAACTRYAECGKPLDCEHYLALCPDYIFAPGSSRGVSDVLACAVVRRNQDCAELLAGIDPPCATPGTRKKGEPCDFSGQCESFSCSSFGSCGTCAGTTPPDSGCPKPGDACGHNMVCPSDAVGCVPKTVPPHLAAGDVCPEADGGGRACPLDAPCLAAGPLADAGVCTPRPSSGACAFDTRATRATECSAGNVCARADAAAPEGTCVPGAPVGDACGASIGVTCASGLYCSDANSGVCKAELKSGDTCQSAIQCGAGTYCQLTGPAVGTCVAGPTLGQPCDTKVTDAGFASTPICVNSVCASVPQPEGGTKAVCVNKPAWEQAACAPPLTPCYPGLVCGTDGTCALPACPIPDAGKD